MAARSCPRLRLQTLFLFPCRIPWAVDPEEAFVASIASCHRDSNRFGMINVRAVKG